VLPRPYEVVIWSRFPSTVGLLDAPASQAAAIVAQARAQGWGPEANGEREIAHRDHSIFLTRSILRPLPRAIEHFSELSPDMGFEGSLKADLGRRISDGLIDHHRVEDVAPLLRLRYP